MDVYFSVHYQEARHRFLDSASRAGAMIQSYPLEGDWPEELAIDVAILGEDDSPTIATSSAVHGVEGFLGSAIQLATLERIVERGIAAGARHVMIHGVNPYGFANLRRFNEDNVDLNRNFHSTPEGFGGAPEGYQKLDPFLNPKSPPSPSELYMLKAVYYIARYGMQNLKQAIAGGQYEYPQGIFFGGKQHCQSTNIVCDNFANWLGDSQQIVHLDYHTGLGPSATYKLLMVDSKQSEAYQWCADAFGAEFIEASDKSGDDFYQASGEFGSLIGMLLKGREYRYMCAEFGTHKPIRVLGALRAENRAHHYGDPTSELYKAVKQELLECFCPKSSEWRNQVVASGIAIVDQAAKALA